VANWHDDDVSILVNNGDGTFAADVTYGAGTQPFSIAVGDLDADGDLDLAVANFYSENVSILLNECPPACPADLDGDGSVGIVDLLLVLSNWGGPGGDCTAMADGTGNAELSCPGNRCEFSCSGTASDDHTISIQEALWVYLPVVVRNFEALPDLEVVDILIEDNANPDYPTRTKGVVEKCNFCEERLGKGMLPACVEACPEKAMVFGDLEHPGSPVRELLASRYSIRRKPELGTQPEIYYLV